MYSLRKHLRKKGPTFARKYRAHLAAVIKKVNIGLYLIK